MAGRRYTVTLARGDAPGQWIASIDEIPGCHTFGKGLGQTRRRIREALSLWIGTVAARRAELEERLPLPRELAAALDAIEALKVRVDDLERTRAELAKQRRKVVRTLVRQRKWSLRDVSHLVGLTFQRVEQLAKGS